MASTLMASQTLILQNPTLSTHRTEFNPNSVRHHHHLLSSYSTPKLHLSLSSRKPKRPTIIASCSTLSTNLSQIENPPHSLLTGSCRTVTSLLGIVLAASKIFAHKFLNLAMQLKSGPGLAQPLIYSAGPAFFAAIRDTSPGTLNTPLTVVAAGMAKWLDIYSGVLMVRVLLSWFPNIPWDRQPLSAIRDLCDPYLNLFRNIIPPIFDTLDVSPLMAFGVLGVLGSILSSTRGY